MFRNDTHNSKYSPRQKTDLVVAVDFSGGLNLADNPLGLKQNELLEAVNFQYAPTGAAIETRDAVVGVAAGDGEDPVPKSAMSILYTMDGVIYGACSGFLYTMPAAFSQYPVDELMCSDFTWFVYGAWMASDVPEKCSDFVGVE